MRQIKVHCECCAGPGPLQIAMRRALCHACATNPPPSFVARVERENNTRRRVVVIDDARYQESP